MTLYYQEYGNKNGPLMVFLHGGGVSSWMWEKHVEFFTDYHCVTIDLPEQGKSNQTDYFTIRYSAREVIALIEELAPNKNAIVIGFSLGAQVIVQMLSMNPNICQHAIINSALVRPSLLMKKLIAPSVKITFPLVRKRWFSKLQAKTLYINEKQFDTYYKESSNMKADTLIRILEENMSFAIPKDFDKATCKILVTVGEKEKSIMKKSARDIVSGNSECTGVIIPQIGHGLPIAYPSYFNEMVKDWIEKGVLPADARLI